MEEVEFFNKMLKTLVRECLHEEMDKREFLKNVPTLKEQRLKADDYENHQLNEMAKLNTKEFFSLFPYNKFDIVVYSNDHEPPHFHVVVNGWNIVVGIADGKILDIRRYGKNSSMYTFVKNNIEEWLESPSLIDKAKTNREIAFQEWAKVAKCVK